MRRVFFVLASTLALALAGGAAAESHEEAQAAESHEGHATESGTASHAMAHATLENTEGTEIGKAVLTETPNGVLVQAQFSGLNPGAHGFHIHETGSCEAPDFKSAGGHLNPAGAEHGFLDEGLHAGDLPNIFAPDSGDLKVDVFAHGMTFAQLFDADGAAVVVHSGPDDYHSEPSGAAGSRLACGVIERAPAE